MSTGDEGSLGGVTLEQFAGVTAATAEGIPLVEVLEQEQIPPEAWPEGARLWREAIVDTPSLQIELVRLRRVAEDCLRRDIDPLDGDASSWVGLLRALGEAADTASVLAALGLTSSDVSRLGRQWRDKAKANPEVEKALQDVSATATAPTEVRVGPLVLRPFPWSARPVVRAAPPRTVGAAEGRRDEARPNVVVQRASFQLESPRADVPSTVSEQTEVVDGRGLVALLTRDPLPFSPGPPSIVAASAPVEDVEHGDTLMADGSAIRVTLIAGALPFANREDQARSSVEGRIERFAAVQAALVRVTDPGVTLATFGFSGETWELERRSLASELARNPALQALYERAWHAASKA
ncbi:MAG: hypothetical protein U0414_21810 [Polyangiaceae bacterium]